MVGAAGLVGLREGRRGGEQRGGKQDQSFHGVSCRCTAGQAYSCNPSSATSRPPLAAAQDIAACRFPTDAHTPWTHSRGRSVGRSQRRVTLEPGFGAEGGWIAAGVFDRRWRRDDRWVYLGDSERRAAGSLRHPARPGFTLAPEALQAYVGRYELVPGYWVLVDARRQQAPHPVSALAAGRDGGGERYGLRDRRQRCGARLHPRRHRSGRRFRARRGRSADARAEGQLSRRMAGGSPQAPENGDADRAGRAAHPGAGRTAGRLDAPRRARRRRHADGDLPPLPESRGPAALDHRPGVRKARGIRRKGGCFAPETRSTWCEPWTRTSTTPSPGPVSSITSFRAVLGRLLIPRDFRARRSPTLTPVADRVAAAMADGRLAKDDVWEVALQLWAHVHGYVSLYRAGRFRLSEARFRDLYHRAMVRLVRGLEAHSSSRPA